MWLDNFMSAPDTIMIFGDSGSGKTSFALTVVKHYIGQGKKVLYLDTERNIISKPEGDYKFIPSLEEVKAEVTSLKKGYDLVVLDSLGLPILGKFSLMDMKQRGEALLMAECISYLLKIYSKDNNCMVIVLNQPESEFAKPPYHLFRPFADKAIYFYKEVWKSHQMKSAPEGTECMIDAFRSRKYGRKTELFRMVIDNSGVKIDAKV